MPLVRYEVRCEHSLANPELYRTAGQDDSEGLLEGVAMAGLVGLVRQLGDLAEFAAEIFHGLHDDIKALVSRSRNLKTRVARLEVDLPALEKALIAECSQFQFAYSARTKWRAPLPMDLNLCAQGELPLFVRNFYDDCRGPPRLFLLDKFDEAGRGACVKRYTDPTFFRISWAASLVSKAEQQRREREAELQRKTTAADDNAGPKIPPRERLSSALFENLEGFTGDFTPELLSRRMDHRSFDELLPPEGMLTPEDSRSPEEPRSPAAAPRSLPQVAQGPVLAPLKMSSKDHRGLPRGLPRGVVMDSSSVLMDSSPVLSEDESSSDDDAEFYVDALTTMGSDDPDSEPGSRTSRWEVDSNPSRFGLESEEEELVDREDLNNLVLKSLVEAHRKTPPRMEEDEDEDEEEVERNEDFVRRLGLDEVGTGFDTVREWEDSRAQTEEGSVEDSIELASVASVGEEDAQNCLAIVARSVFQEEPLLAELPDRSSDKSPEKLLPDKPPDYHSDTPSDKFPYSSADKPPDDLSDRLPAGLLLITLPERLPSSPPDSRPTPLIDSLLRSPPHSLPRSPPHSLPTPALDEVPDTFSDKLPYQTPDAQLHSGPPPSTLPTSPSDKGSDTVSAQVPNELKPRDGKLPQASPQARSDKSSDKVPDKSSSKPRDGKLPSLPKRPHGRSDKLPDKLSAKSPSKPAAKSPSKPAAKPPPEKPTYQSHDSVSLLDSFRSSVRVKPIIASLGARAHTQASESTLKPEKSSTSPVTPPKGRRLWTKENATQIHTSILQFADMDQRGDPSEENFPDLGDERHAHHVSMTSDVEGYTSSASSTPKGLPNFWVLLSPSESPPRVAEGLMRPPSLFDGRYPHLPPVTPFLAGSPSVSRSPSLNAKSAGPGAISVPTQGTPGAAREVDKLQNVPATSPKRVSENGVLQLDPSRNQPSTLPNPVPRPRTWVDRSASNVAATLRAIRQAATVASDDDAGSECWTDC